MLQHSSLANNGRLSNKIGKLQSLIYDPQSENDEDGLKFSGSEGDSDDGGTVLYKDR